MRERDKSLDSYTYFTVGFPYELDPILDTSQFKEGKVPPSLPSFPLFLNLVGH
ncbi:unnamed protein product [Meloidogyne enterolobii]|uniref:Uncharacterized protein n=1 Tax=Meloidogyne enterolobii TaxID=390850 RepID=A0ACB1AQK1_MELEN